MDRPSCPPLVTSTSSGSMSPLSTSRANCARSVSRPAAGARSHGSGRLAAREPAALVTFTGAGWAPVPSKLALDKQRINSALSYRELAQYDFGDKDVDWALRLSPHYYNTEDEVDTVADAVAALRR